MSIVVTTEAVIDLLHTERAFLLERLAEVCPDHTRCLECGTPMCEVCKVGGASRCGHGDAICERHDPTDRCGDCYVEHREAAAAARAGYQPPTVVRSIPCPVCSGVGAIQHPSRNPELIEDCGRCRGYGEVAA